MALADFQPPDAQRFAAAIRRFDEENSLDPTQEQVAGKTIPRELLYAQRLTDWVLRLEPGASEVLRLAARSQHLCRWFIPRDSYPLNRSGYLQWRTELKKLHATKTGAILREVGYPEEVVRRVQELNLKRNFPEDPEVRTLEDALCLAFLQFQFSALAARMTEDKTINAVRKSWAKMTDKARHLALQLDFSPEEKALIQRAVATERVS